jgi:hypothetical protein
LYRALFGDESSQVELAETFKSSSQVLIGPGSGFEDFSALHEVNLVSAKDALEVSASGSDPQLLLPKIELAAGKRGILRIDITAPVDTGLQLFYRPPGVSEYGGYHMDRFIRRGRNSVFFEFSDFELAGGPLRLDPGMVAGRYVITGFEFRSVEGNE